MGMSEKPGLLDNRMWAGKAFDGAWQTTLSGERNVTEPATGKVLGTSTFGGPVQTVETNVCGQRTLQVQVKRLRGSVAFSLGVSRP